MGKLPEPFTPRAFTGNSGGYVEGHRAPYIMSPGNHGFIGAFRSSQGLRTLFSGFPEPSRLNPKPPNPKPQTLNPKPQALNPKP